MKKIFTILLITFVCAISVNAQVSYSFTALQGIYTPISGGTIPSFVTPDLNNLTTSDEGFANKVPIGFTFVYNGVSYDSININANGFISLGEGFAEDPSENSYFNSLKAGPLSQNSVRPVIAPLWDDLDFGAEDSITYLLTGVAPNRVLTVQWANAYWRYVAQDPSISFQVKLYETTNAIEFFYRQEAGATGSPSASIGITSTRTGAGNFMSVSNSSGSPTISTTSDSLIATAPATNQVYRFIPLTCIAPSVTQLTNVTSIAATLSWNTVPGVANYEYASSTSATPPASGTATSSTSVNLTGLTPGVNNYFYVRSACGGGTFSQWSSRATVICTTNVLPADGATVSKPATISWNAIPGATGYTIMLSTDGINFSNTGTVSGSSTSTQLMNLTHDSTYYFYVRPVAGSDTASTSCQASATSFIVGPAPVIPCTTNTFPLNNAANVSLPATISWTPIAGATDYDIMFSSDGGATYDDLGGIGDSTTSILLTGLNFNATYHYYVRPIIGEDTASTTCVSNATAFTTANNDSCGGAVSIVPGNGALNGTTVNATPSPSGAICPEPQGVDPSDPDDDVWYKFTAVANGSAIINVIGDASFDAVLSMYSGSCGSLTLVNCSDTSGQGGLESVTMDNLISGQTYYARVYDYYPGNPGGFTISVSGSALPVTMSDLHGTTNGYKNVLTWNTQTEINNKGFEVERSANGIDFDPLNFVATKAPAGNSSSVLNYSFPDNNPLSGNSYYRLKQIDKGEKSVYSNIVLLKGTEVTQLQLSNLYPNPSKSVLNIEIASPLKNNIKLVITDLAGKIVMQQSNSLLKGNNNLKINIGKLSSGSYFIKAVCANGCGSAVRKFVKQ